MGNRRSRECNVNIEETYTVIPRVSMYCGSSETIWLHREVSLKEPYLQNKQIDPSYAKREHPRGWLEDPGMMFHVESSGGAYP